MNYNEQILKAGEHDDIMLKFWMTGLSDNFKRHLDKEPCSSSTLTSCSSCSSPAASSTTTSANKSSSSVAVVTTTTTTSSTSTQSVAK